MIDTCCSVPLRETEALTCPASGREGRSVKRTTVAALSVAPLPPRQEFRLCRDAECEVVYHGSAGAVLTVGDLTVRPGFKDGPDGLVCYCFGYRAGDIVRQLEATGTTDVYDSIRREVEAGNCACEVRNPSGNCCLGEVRDTIRQLRRELEGTA